MNAATVWWLMVGGLIGLELMTGTFYLLMLAIGAAAAAMAAHAGMDVTGQVTTAALIGGLAVIFWSVYRRRQTSLAPSKDRDVHFDIGETVLVQAWNANGSTQVKHRGALWGAVISEGHPLEPGLHRIEAIIGNRLILKKI